MQVNTNCANLQELFLNERKNILKGKPRNIESLDTTTLSGRLHKEILQNYSSVNAFVSKTDFHLTEVQRYVKGTYKPTLDKLLKMREAGLDIDYIIDGDGSEEKELSCKLYNMSVAAGTNNPLLTDDYTTIKIPKWMDIDFKDPFACYIVGKSMEPTFYEKDIVIVETTSQAKNSDVVICVYDGSALIKQFIQEDDKIYLRSFNPDFPDVEVRRKSKFRVVGVVRRCFSRRV